MTEPSRRGLAAASLATAGALILGSASAAQAATGDNTFDRVRGSKTLRVGVVPGASPYFIKDIATGAWSGAAIDMANDVAKAFDAKTAFVETTWGNAVLDLQANKIDLAFALNPTPARALSITFAHPMIIHPFGCIGRPGFTPSAWTWDALNKPEVRITCDIGSLHEVLARRYCPKAQITAFKEEPDALLALQTGKADVIILAAMLGIAALGKNASLGTFHILNDPFVALPSNLGVQRETDTRFVEVINAWLDYNRGLGNIREWMIKGLIAGGAKPESIPSELTF
jgi:polar amino acid transport system substrate-binding protein